VRRGIRLGLDLGSVRIGVAISDPDGQLAVPLQTVARGPGDVEAIAALVAERDAIEVVLGLPRSLHGGEARAAELVRDYSVTLAARVAPVPVRLVDERFSTVAAQQGLRRSGVRGKRQRAVVDQVAAAHILQSALDAERARNEPPGEIVR
jgi:putative Holliday junction resolvase